MKMMFDDEERRRDASESAERAAEALQDAARASDSERQ